MFDYYTAICLLTWAALGTLCVLVRENARIRDEDKRIYYLSYTFIVMAALAEWCGVRLDGAEGLPKWPLLLVKALDYSLTPMAGGLLVAQLRMRDRVRCFLMGLLAFNLCLQLISCFTGWMVQIDAAGRYHHGPLYMVYMLVYLAVLVIVILEFFRFGQRFRRQNRLSLYAIMSLVLTGILIQEIGGSQFRTAYLTLTLGALLLYIHLTEFSQLQADEDLSRQQIQIDTDALTGLLSRHAYSKALEKYAADALPGDAAVFTLDINGLKTVNDNMGHEAGDELIRGAASCIEKVLSDKGSCYRTGGDEFVVLAQMDREQAEEALKQLQLVCGAWSGEKVKDLSLAVGFALSADYPGFSAEKLVNEADLSMYVAKADYYRNSGKDRRRRRSTDPPGAAGFERRRASDAPGFERRRASDAPDTERRRASDAQGFERRRASDSEG